METTIRRIKEWISARLREAQIQDYYYSGGNTSKHYRARSMDRLSARMAVFVLTAVSFYVYTGNFFAALFFGGVCTYLFDRLAMQLRNKRSEKNRAVLLEKEGIDRFTQLLEDKDNRGFFEIIFETLKKTCLFKGLKLIEDDEGRPLIITGEFKGEKVGIYANRLGKDASVKEANLKEFVQYCKSRQLGNGIYIASGPFDYASRGYAAGLDSFNLYIADTQTIYRAFIKKGFLFSMDDLEEKLEQRVFEHNKETQHSLKRILAYRRIRTYIVLGVLIAVYSAYVPYSVYYILVSIVLLCLSLTALIRWKIEKFMEDSENSIKLDSLMDAE
jgi:hypothetical protein